MLILGKTEGRRRRDDRMNGWMYSMDTGFGQAVGGGEGQKPGLLQPIGSQE